jgi:hypothetical protein
MAQTRRQTEQKISNIPGRRGFANQGFRLLTSGF